MTSLRSSFFASAVMTLVIAGMFGTSIATTRAATTVSAGDLIRGTTFSAVYYMGADGFRYVFPNEKTYKTWYSDSSGNPDFSDVITISDASLADIQIGGNVTYKPGVRMIKINSDEKTYFVGQDGALYWVASETMATTLYGSNWNKDIDDVPDGFFANYTLTDREVSASIAEDEIAQADTSYTIDDDKGLIEPENISIADDGYDPIDVTICVDQTVRFTNDGDDKHTVTADDLTWGSGTLQAGDDFVKRFSEEGTYSFYDGYDSVNTGAIYVEDCEVVIN